MVSSSLRSPDAALRQGRTPDRAASHILSNKQRPAQTTTQHDLRDPSFHSAQPIAARETGTFPSSTQLPCAPKGYFGFTYAHYCQEVTYDGICAHADETSTPSRVKPRLRAHHYRRHGRGWQPPRGFEPPKPAQTVGMQPSGGSTHNSCGLSDDVVSWSSEGTGAATPWLFPSALTIGKTAMRLAPSLRLTFTLLPSLVLALAVFAPPAHAVEGVNLRWDQCYGDAGAQNKSFACDTNTGTETLVGSFVLGAEIVQMGGEEVVIDLASAGSALPPWWQFMSPGACRQTALSVNMSLPATAVNCMDWSHHNANLLSGSYSIGARGPSTARLDLLITEALAAVANVPGGEYLSFNLTITHAKSVGTDACAGCTTPVCIVLNSVLAITAGRATDRFLTGPANGTDSNFATWQGGGSPVVGGVSGCPAATPARQPTWGAVKALYR